jgi:Uma2 family endonuclease
MPVPPAPLPRSPMSAEEYIALPEDVDTRFELQEGTLVMSPSPTVLHQECSDALGEALRAQTPKGLKVISDVDVDLRLVVPGGPGTVRAPDLVVVTREARLRIRESGGILVASDVVLAVEIISPSSRRMDMVIKHSEYADAGIGHYWIIDPADGPSLTACHLGGEFGYVDDEPVRGTFTTEHPFPVTIDVASLDAID